MNLVIYGKSNCIQCNRIKNLLEGEIYTYKTLDIDFSREEIIELYPDLRQYPLIISYGVPHTYIEYVKIIEDKKKQVTYEKYSSTYDLN